MSIKLIRVISMLFSILSDKLSRHNISVLSTEKTLDTLIKNKVSISRFGDGEFNLLLGNDMPFQSASPELRASLRRVLIDQDNNHRCLVAIPGSFVTVSHLTLKSKFFWIKYFAKFRNDLLPFLNNQYVYGYLQISRIYINRKDKLGATKNFDNWKEIFKNKHILLVEGSESKFGVGNDLFENTLSISRVICPSRQTFQVYEELLDYLSSVTSIDLILLALGPTVTVLSYDFSKISNIQIIDTGNMDLEYEWMKLGVTKPTKINHKYSIEVKNGTETVDIEDGVYESQIIKRIGVNGV
ncbi:glycosyl transferase, putative [Streptococcus acidominimus]|uniref:Glycosyl transferase, putative n=1 Tax=Streptococcus acidominimus TaxID=1326 RepID=A0A239X5Q7_STRAI|nr:GT-D fold domain-containing glycosyltransferase [Streptococcus acidominimus]SNV41388.1 glycosyl transferase, putative [Streptococcus acidominimus]